VSSTPKKEQLEGWIEDAARRVAFDLGLPWKLRELREHGRRGVANALNGPSRGSGLPFPQQIQRHITEEVRKGGKSMRAQAQAQGGKRQLPTDERIKDALKTFSVEEWKDFIAEFEYKEVRKLGSFLKAHREEHEHAPERKKYVSVDIFARERRMVLQLSHPKAKLIAITDPFWDAHWQEKSRARNLEGAPRPSERRSWSEMASERAIAEALSEPGYTVTPYQVKKWRERMEQEPFEEFDGDIDDYLLKMRDPAAYERLRRRREQGEE
jgi:hypothetical protein